MPAPPTFPAPWRPSPVELDTEVEAGDHVLTLLRVLELRRDPLIFFGSDTYRLAS